jgi:serine/threonine protein phosphatase PrpC
LQDLAVFGAFDGHSGYWASQFCSDTLLTQIKSFSTKELFNQPTQSMKQGIEDFLFD